MKIAILSRGIPSPSAPMNGIFEWDQARALRDAGHDVRFLVLDYRRVLDRPMGWSEYARDGMRVFSFSLPTGMYRRLPWLLRRRALSLYKRMAAACGPADLLHSHFYFISALAEDIKRDFPDLPWVVTEHSSKLNKPLESISALDRRVARRAFRHADGRVCVSPAYAAKLRSGFGYEFTVIPNVVDLDDFRFEAVDPRPASRPFRFVSAGSLIEGKRMSSLLRAFARCGFPATLGIIGDGPQRLELEREAKQLGVADRVTFYGMLRRPEMAALYREADAFALLSASETFGVAYIEAMAMGLPVIAAASGGPDSFVRPEDGLVVPVDDEAAAVQAMDWLYRHYTDYHPAGIAAACRARFAPEAIARCLTDYYAALCNQK